jgi:hypothetical protein
MDDIECKYSDEACYEYEIKGFHTIKMHGSSENVGTPFQTTYTH